MLFAPLVLNILPCWPLEMEMRELQSMGADEDMQDFLECFSLTLHLLHFTSESEGTRCQGREEGRSTQDCSIGPGMLLGRAFDLVASQDLVFL